MKIDKNCIYVYGKQPIFLMLKNQKRSFHKLYTNNLKELNDFIKENDIKINKNVIEEKSNNDISKIIDEDVNHQGYFAIVNNRKMKDFDDFLKEDCKNKNSLPRLLLLDEIKDPHNVGAIIRTAVAFDVCNIIVTARNSISDSSTIIKTSAGYSEFVNLIEVNNLNSAINELKNVGYFVMGLDGETKSNIKEMKDSKDICLVLGNEGKGLRELVKKNCDFLCKIDMKNNVESLNVSVACAIGLYQLWS